ncbi:hypothetical protein P4O66_001187 [Electrophorus voltai]|uniref:Uncharacterized protein n=1 Tax=Electrophorus voltai TaxID=2609070 RepID=A0AAD8ZAV7_9TELE|nr:hypothetical protein P4O66_001187 [Electrophorus voltai]
MEVEELKQEDPLSLNDTVISEEEEPPAPKTLPRARRSGASKQTRASGREAASAEEEPPLPKTRSNRAHAPTPKPREGKKAAAPGPAPPLGNPTGGHPDAHAPGSGYPPTSERARDTPPQAGWPPTHLTIGGLAGAIHLKESSGKSMSSQHNIMPLAGYDVDIVFANAPAGNTGVTCQDDAAPPVPQIMTAASAYMVGAAYVRGDNVPSTPRPKIQADAKGMRDKFNNDNIKDKVDIEEAELIFVKYSRAVLVSVLLTGLLLAALLIAGYLLTTHRRQAKGMRVAEDLFQVDEQNQGNTLLSVTPLPSQEPLDKPTSNGESPESPPTNGYSTTQTPVADTQM